MKFVIKIKKKVMSEKAMTLGFTHPEVVKYSQVLDLLLNNKRDFKKNIIKILIKTKIFK
ncbi:aspartyl-phosphate phosphatase Spo0E family protein [Psychrobacillus psychrodurans]|uniref:aspartyl-phosphate phosphatase Spo0E family protein n=1 Tax=Psychrobacillus psychrodurans TaxID=126157 RepID=UPI002FD39AA7